MIRVLLVNEIELMNNIIGSVIEDENDIKIVGQATTLEEALEQVSQADVVLVSTRLSENNAIKVTEILVKEKPAVKVLVLGLQESEKQILKYVEAGADGYILRDDSVGELLKNIRAADNEKAFVPPDVAYALLSRLNELAQVFSNVNSGIEEPVDLTPREREVLGLIAEGHTNKEIAEQLYIEVGTVKNHVHSILQKMDVSSRDDAAAFLALLD